MKNIIYIISMSIVFICCSNKYEEALTGTYEVSTYKVSDSSNMSNSMLSLNSNKSFIFICNHNKVRGTWMAYDDGDRTNVELEYKNYIIQGIALDGFNQIKIINGQQKLNGNLAEIVFIKH
jgi:hypothetical protein